MLYVWWRNKVTLFSHSILNATLKPQVAIDHMFHQLFSEF
jgi:hypothetical protein